MLYDGYNTWDECPEADDCELIRSFLELVDAMVRDIQHLKAEAIRARYRFAMEVGDGGESKSSVLKKLHEKQAAVSEQVKNVPVEKIHKSQDAELG